MNTSFYTYATSGFGTMFAVLIIVSYLQGHTVDIGGFGLFLVVIASLIYAFYRRNHDKNPLPPKENVHDA